MRHDVEMRGLSLYAQGASGDGFLESVFFTGNGRLGIRGYIAARPQPAPPETGLYGAGVYGELRPGLTDLVCLPAPLLLRAVGLRVDGDVRRSLNLDGGEFSAEYELAGDKRRVSVRERRVAPPEQPGQIFFRLELELLKGGAFMLEEGIDLSCRNHPVPDDQTKPRGSAVTLFTERDFSRLPDGSRLTLEAAGTGLTLRYEQQYHAEGEDIYAPGDLAGRRFLLRDTLVIEKAVSVFTSRDADPWIAPLAGGWSYAAALESACAHWSKRRARWNIRAKGERETALHYIAYQLAVSCNGRDSSVSIGARGLTHSRYKGCYFWDTDIFILPFFLDTDLAAARSLARYRIGCLPQARAHARAMDSTGARFPWMASFDGSEQCESWDIGASEVHVTADVAYAVAEYMRLAKDTETFLHGGAELLIETARFWLSRCSRAPEGGYNLLFCKGPDEYCGITNNNLYTNAMVKRNLEMAIEAAAALERLDPRQTRFLGVDEAQVEAWRALAEGLKLPRDAQTGAWQQDETFHLLEETDVNALKRGDEASYHRVCFDRLQRYRVIKQADVLLLMTRLPDLFTPEERMAAWREFEPRCLHDSTLSFATHALFAAQNGLNAEAEVYFEKSLFLDLRDIMANTGHEGLHHACMGEAWSAAKALGLVQPNQPCP